MTTIADARRALASKFRGAGLDSPDLDARILTGHALDLDHAALASNAGRELHAEELHTIDALAARRLGGEPVARIIGVKEFWGLALQVTPATLVPRPDTETVVEAALTAIDAGGSRRRALRVADLGTGSGALLLALLSELPNAFGIATDLNVNALQTARDNARRHKLEMRAHICRLRLRCGAAAAASIWSWLTRPMSPRANWPACLPKCGTTRSVHSTAARTASIAIARSPRTHGVSLSRMVP